MGVKDEEFMRQLRQAFAEEAQEHLQTITDGLLDMEKQPPPGPDDARLEVVYRAAHSLKGAARAVNERRVEQIAHTMENVFTDVRKGRLELKGTDHDHLQRTLDVLGGLLAGDEPSETDMQSVLHALDLLSGFTGPPEATEAETDAAPGGESPPVPPEAAPGPGPARPPEAGRQAPDVRPVERPPEAPARAAGGGQRQAAPSGYARSPETMRVAVSKLDSFLFRAEGMLSGKLALEQRIAETRELANTLDGVSKQLAKLGNETRTAHAREVHDALRSGVEALENGLGIWPMRCAPICGR